MPRVGLDPARVTQTAARIADESGVEAVTVARVARELDVRPPSLYSHVAGTDDLRTRVTLLALQEIAERTTDAVAGRSRAEALRGVAEAIRAYALEHPGRYAAARRRLDAVTAAGSAGGRSRDAMQVVLRDYGVPDHETVHAVRVVSSTLHGFVSLETAGGFAHSAPDAEASWQRMLEVLDGLLAQWPSRSRQADAVG